MDAHPTLPSELTIFTVSESCSQCRAWLDDASNAPANEQPLAVSADRVIDIDAAGIQLLMSLHNSLSQRGRELRLLNPSTVLSDACRALGAAGLLRTINGGAIE